jgi:hypothetical protein
MTNYKLNVAFNYRQEQKDARDLVRRGWVFWPSYANGTYRKSYIGVKGKAAVKAKKRAWHIRGFYRKQREGQL